MENRKVLSAFCPDLNEIFDEFINLIKIKRNSENVVKNFEEYMQLASVEASCCLILGRKMGYLNGNIEDSENLRLKELGEAARNIFSIFRDAYYGELENIYKLLLDISIE